MANRSQKELPNITIEDVQSKVNSLLNKKAAISSYNRGKNIVVEGKIVSAYKSVFVFECAKNSAKKSYTYADVVSGKIILEGLE